MAKLLKNGKSPIEAYEALGFDTSIVGKNRAYMAAKRALKNAEKENYGISLGDYDGSIEREKMGDLSPEEELAYYKARALYLEKVVEFQKKNSTDIGGQRYIFTEKELNIDKLQIADSLIAYKKELTKRACLRICGVSKSSYYNYLKHREEIHLKQLEEKKELEEIMEKFRAIIHKLGHIPGKRTFKTHMWQDFGRIISVRRVKKIMNTMHLVPTLPKKDAYLGQATHFHECACTFNYVNQDFKIGPRRVILTDITYLYYGLSRTVCYLCVFKDTFTGEILGFAVSRKMDVALVKEAYDMMMENMEKRSKPIR